jgi:two-component system, LytTR family, response regulator AlgR
MTEGPLRILVVDDEAPARKRLRDLLDDCRADFDLQVVGEAGDGVAALDLLNRQEVDVALVDIRMPAMDGLELARHAQKLPHPPAIVFTTAFDAYAVKAFDLNALDYLMKPIRKERLAAALQRAVSGPAGVALRLQRAAQRARRHLSVVDRGMVVLVPVGDILYLRAEQKYVTVRTAAREYLVEESLSALEAEFGDVFVRIHRSCIVRRDAIVRFERATRGEGEGQWVVVLAGLDDRLPISRRQQHIVRRT